jgi:predicted ArsR family transcriptional regulator
VSRWQDRFLDSSRGRVVDLLRRARRTVEELARAMGVTDNAVRAHLAALERDGLIRTSGARPSGGKPAVVYELTREAEEFLSSAYAPILTRIVEVMNERAVSAEGARDVLREAGRRLARQYPAGVGVPRARLEAAGRLLGALGGVAHVEALEDGRLRLQGVSCPLGSVVREHPEVCVLAEALVAEASGLPVREHCEREPDEPPRCRFHLEPAAAS